MAEANSVSVSVDDRRVVVRVGTDKQGKEATLSAEDVVRLQKELARAAQEQ